MSEHLELRKDGPVASLVINRPEKRNAISHEMWKAIPGRTAEVGANLATNVMVLRGAGGKALSAGADASDFAKMRSTEGSTKAGEHICSEATAAAEHAVMGPTKPTIAIIERLAIGRCYGLSLSSGVRFTDPGARLGIRPAKLGLVYSFPTTKKLIDLSDPFQATVILFSGNHVVAEEAARIGMIDAMHLGEELEECTTVWCGHRRDARRSRTRRRSASSASFSTPTRTARRSRSGCGSTTSRRTTTGRAFAPSSRSSRWLPRRSDLITLHPLTVDS